MKECEVTVNISSDKDVSPVAMLVQTASRFESGIYIDCGDKHVNAKSIMGMMSLAPANGTKLTVSADGPDEEEACRSMEEFLMGRSGK